MSSSSSSAGFDSAGEGPLTSGVPLPLPSVSHKAPCCSCWRLFSSINCLCRSWIETLLVADFCDFKDNKLPNWSPVAEDFAAPLRVLDGREMLFGDAVPDRGIAGLARKLLMFEARLVGFKGAAVVVVEGLGGFCQSSPSKSSIAVAVRMHQIVVRMMRLLEVVIHGEHSTWTWLVTLVEHDAVLVLCYVWMQYRDN